MDNADASSDYASFSHVGTWTKGVLCQKCEQPTSKLISPLMIEWEPGSSVIGDFSWCGYTVVVSTSTRNFLIDSGADCEFRDVVVVAPTTKSKKIVPYPYEGPKLKWLIPTNRIPLNESKSGVKLLIDCDECKQKKYTFKAEGLHIDKNNWLGQNIFYIEQYTRSDAIFVTEEIRNIILKSKLSNITFSEAGIIE